MIRLFHLTDNEAAIAILSSGFRDSEEGGVWFRATSILGANDRGLHSWSYCLTYLRKS